MLELALMSQPTWQKWKNT